MDRYKQSYFNIIAILIMLVGIVLFWLKVDATGRLLSVGFFCMGIYAFIETLKANVTPRMKAIRFVLALFIMAAAVYTILAGEQFLYVGIAMLFYIGITRPAKFSQNGKSSA